MGETVTRIEQFDFDEYERKLIQEIESESDVI